MKIFGIGFHKTGTTSLKEALKILGFSVRGPFGVVNPNIENEAWDLAREIVPRYDAFQDNPWPLLYEKLDAHYPGSKFILTVREPTAWIRSVSRHFGGKETAMRKWIYGDPDPLGKEHVYLERYARHNQEVVEHFRGREGTDLLVLKITEGDGWEKLCPFLGVPPPGDIPFPHQNRARDRVEKNKLINRIHRKLALARDAMSSRLGA